MCAVASDRAGCRVGAGALAAGCLCVKLTPVEEISCCAGLKLYADELLFGVAFASDRRPAPTNFARQEEFSGSVGHINPQIQQCARRYRCIGAELDATDGKVHRSTGQRSADQFGPIAAQNDLREQSIVAFKARVHTLVVMLTVSACCLKALSCDVEFDHVRITHKVHYCLTMAGLAM